MHESFILIKRGNTLYQYRCWEESRCDGDISESSLLIALVFLLKWKAKSLGKSGLELLGI